jgi:hypothetical protein
MTLTDDVITAINANYPSDSTLDIVTNGTFTGDTDWTKGANWAITTYAEKTAGGVETLSQTLDIHTSWYYVVKFTVSNRTAGTITVSVGATAGTARSTNATFTEIIVCGATTLLAFTPDATFDGRIDDVVVNPIPFATDERKVSYKVHNPGCGVWELTAERTPSSITEANFFVNTPFMLLIRADSAAKRDAIRDYLLALVRDYTTKHWRATPYRNYETNNEYEALIECVQLDYS